ncbi:universal stress protein [Natrinema versiforme]|uniref:Universal stress protein n=1 Tax=Natrinema versiforme TaxID=88724 RepID=A0A4P8WND7_9EURY|nr:universal stress protein [Natrinema versiforme]QCS44974.1 universal stress protein [Natrinema versiforme]
MDVALVAILGEKVDTRLLNLANQFATGTETEIVVCKFINEENYQNDVKEASRKGHQAPSSESIKEEAEKTAREAAERVFDADVNYSARGAVGPLPKEVLETAADLSCDHLFITAKRRSPAGKVLFRDAAQSLMLKFDGSVTVNFNHE